MFIPVETVYDIADDSRSASELCKEWFRHPVNAVFFLVAEGVCVMIGRNTARVVARLSTAGPLVRSCVKVRGVLRAFELPQIVYLSIIVPVAAIQPDSSPHFK